MEKVKFTYAKSELQELIARTIEITIDSLTPDALIWLLFYKGKNTEQQKTRGKPRKAPAGRSD